jgi:hypothetical protein
MLQVLPQVFLGEHDHPDQLAQGNFLVSAAGADRAVALSNVKFAFAKKPVPQMTIYFVDALLQLICGNLAKVVCELGSLHLLQQPSG